MLIATLFASLPLTVFALLALMGRARGSGWRESILQAATAWGALVVVVTEGLSSVTFLNRISLACAWGLLAFLVLVVYRYLWTTLVPGDRNGSVFKDAESAFTSQLAIGAIMVIWGLVGLTAIFAPPNTWDAMQYHMPRIVHWLHNQSVAFYPANEIRQLNMPPWAEYAILQFHAATGGDWLDNLVQWFSMGLSALTVSLIVRELGVGKNGQALAAFLCATLPEGILEASAAKNDYVVAFWISATVYFLLTFGRKPSVKTALPLGLAAGLAILTKGTAEIFLAAFAMILVTWDRKTIGQAVRFAPIIVILGLGLNAPHFKRNLELFGSPLGPAAYSPSGQFKLSNDGFTPPIIISNILRNLALQIESPSAVLNSKIEASVGAILKLMGEDLNDPRATWDYTNFHVAEMPRHEGYAGNPLHLGLFLVASAILAFRWLRNRTDFRLLIFAAAVAMGFFLFCVYLKWQPWHTRLLIPAFVVASAISGAVLATTLPTMLQGALLVALPIFAGPALLENIIRPLTYAGDLNVFNQNAVRMN
jgi:4-amino-4-deoxy-L-arabinose transferase-like glycosyltransferase